MTRILKDQRLTLLWALFILIMCNAKFGSMGHSGLFFPGFDKLVHCGFFFVFVVLCSNGYIRQCKIERFSYKQAVAITLIAIMYGALIEILQLTVFTWRTGDWPDLFADTVGACMATFSILITINATEHVKK